MTERDAPASEVELPPELSDALDGDREAADLFAALRERDRREYAEFVAEAKKPETRVRRAAKTLELLRRRQAQKEELKARGKAPITRAIDGVVDDILAPKLKELGFAKSARRWRKETSSSQRIVQVRAARFNTTTSGVLLVDLGFDYPPITGRVVPLTSKTDAIDLSYELTLGGPGHHDRGYPFEFVNTDDPAAVAATREHVERVWTSEFGWPLVDAADDPRRLRDHLLAYGRAGDGLPDAASLSALLRDRSHQRQAVEAYLVSIVDEERAASWDRPDWFCTMCASIAPYLRDVDVRLEGEMRAEAEAGLVALIAEVERGEGRAEWIWHPKRLRGLLALAHHLGIDAQVLRSKAPDD